MSQSADMAWHKQDLLRNIERIAVGMAIVRLDGTLEYANTYLCKMLEVRSGEPVELPFSLFEPRAGPSGQDESQQQPDTGETKRRELRIHSSSGKVLDIMCAVYPLCDDAGVVTHYVHFLQHLGDEFIAILDGVADQQLAAPIASKLLTACGEPYVVRGHEYRITLSVGASFYPRDGHDPDMLLERADRAMYEVKARGRNGCRIEESTSDYGLTAA